MAGSEVRVRRAYEPVETGDGYRVLVDRLWPRGIRSDSAPWDHWAKGVAPSTELRRWYGHQPARFSEFANRYRAELRGADAQAELGELQRRTQRGPLTLITATKEVEISAAQVLMEHLRHGSRR